MRERTYLNFDLLVEPARDGGYRARVLGAPAGETPSVPVTMPFSDLEVENFLLRIGRPRGQSVRGAASPEAAAIRGFGSKLFDAVFRDQVRVALSTSVHQAESQGVGLRLRLRLTDCPELADLPWEYLYNRDARRFLALSEWTPLVRYLDLPGPVRPLAVHPPLRILVLAASPTDFPPLDVDSEWAKLREALGDLERAGRVRADRLPSGTLSDLQRQLRRDDYHVFHYIGHGGYDTQTDDGMLVFETATGRGQHVSGEDLGVLLHDHRTLRLALLNSCEGARGGRTDPYSGSAQSLIRQGIPAVVAMQFEVTDRAAIIFAHSMYEAVADGCPLDAAMAEARKVILHQPNPVEWGTPVLYLRAPDGRVFDLSTDPKTAGRSPSTRDWTAQRPSSDQAGVAGQPFDDGDYTSAMAAFYTERWDAAAELLARVRDRHPEDQQVADRLVKARQQKMLADWDNSAVQAAAEANWGLVIEALEQITAVDAGYRDAAGRLEVAQTQRRVAELRADMQALYADGQWSAVMAADEELVRLDPACSDPEGVATAARAQIADAALTDQYETGLRQLDRGEWAEAVATLSALHKERADYRDTATLLAQARQRIAQPVASPKTTPRFEPNPRTLWVVPNVSVVALSPDGTRLATGAGRRVAVWDLRTGAKEWDRQVGGFNPEVLVTGLDFSRDSSRLATACTSGKTRIWHVASGQEQLVVTTHTGWQMHKVGVAFSPDGTRLATASECKKAQIWNAATGRQQVTIAEPGLENMPAVAFSPDGARLAAGDVDTWIWDAGNGQQQLRIPDAGTLVAFSPDGARLATTSFEETRIWDADTGERQFRVFHPHQVAAAFSHDGARLVTTGGNEMRIWDAATGQLQLQSDVTVDAANHAHPDVWVGAFSPDGARLVAVSGDRTARIWDITTG